MQWPTHPKSGSLIRTRSSEKPNTSPDGSTRRQTAYHRRRQTRQSRLQK